MLAIAMCGTFDVENYGDLIFPLLAKRELERRLGDVSLLPYSYRVKHAPEWPFEVRSNADIAADAGRLNALLLGGGDLIHCIKNIALNYVPAHEGLHHPTSLWLTPALIALGQGVPVLWNAPGVPQEIPRWAAPAVRAMLTGSSYIAVRDENSRNHLAAIAPEADICVVPDSVFGIGALFGPAPPSQACAELAAKAGLHGPYVVLQPAAHGATQRLVRAARLLQPSHQILILPLGPVHAERNANVADSALPGAIRLPRWPDPLALTELIAGADGVIGDSLHLAIAALAFGVPVFRSPRDDLSKYAVLDAFDSVHSLANEVEVTAQWLHARVGRKPPSSAARDAASAVGAHWDRIAEAIAAPVLRPAAEALGNLWQRLPGELESRAELETRFVQAGNLINDLRAENTELRGSTGTRAELGARFAQAGKLIGDLRAENMALRGSLSWRITAPLRRTLGILRGEPRPPTSASTSIIRFEAIEQGQLFREPYGWTVIDDLYAPAQAAVLSATFPRDGFKLVKGYDGEKDYGYHVRALIGMGGATVAGASALSPEWRRLASDLLSLAYRQAMTRLTGVDLGQLRMEVNVFHYGPGAWLGPHVDLEDKIVTHVLYFNPAWDIADGGCLKVLRSASMDDSAFIVPPLVGSSAVLVRSAQSWHAVSKVDPACRESRRSVTVTFYRDGAVSTMWPPGDVAPTFDYDGDGLPSPAGG